MPKKLKITIRENVKTGTRTMDIAVDDGFSRDDVLPESSWAVEAAVLFSLHFPGDDGWPITSTIYPASLPQNEFLRQLRGMARKIGSSAITRRSFNTPESSLLEADDLEARILSFENIYE